MFLYAAIILVLAVLLVAEYGWHKGWMASEVGRKSVHITVGTFVAFWPFWLSWQQIEVLSVAFLIAVILSKYLNIFSAIHSVQRPTYGEICFALVVGILAIVTKNGAIYTAALLQMSLADGLAAVFGTLYGRSTTYHVFGHVKSIVGTCAFFVVSLLILIGYALFRSEPFRMWFIPLAAAATVLENIAVLGLDNLCVPLLVALSLQALR